MFSSSTCGKCGGCRWKLERVEPEGSRFPMYFIQCGSCGVPVAATESRDLVKMIQRQNEAIKAIAARVGAIVDLD